MPLHWHFFCMFFWECRPTLFSFMKSLGSAGAVACTHFACLSSKTTVADGRKAAKPPTTVGRAWFPSYLSILYLSVNDMLTRHFAIVAANCTLEPLLLPNCESAKSNRMQKETSRNYSFRIKHLCLWNLTFLRGAVLAQDKRQLICPVDPNQN